VGDLGSLDLRQDRLAVLRESALIVDRAIVANLSSMRA
jgi:hypothetical protein